MKKEPDLRRDLPVRVAVCVAMGSILTVAFICLFVNFGFNTVVGREAVYLSAFFLTSNTVLIHFRERRWAALFLPMTRAMGQYRTVVNAGWLLGVGLLLASGVLLLCGVGLAEFWSRFTVIAGYVLTLLGWCGNLMAYHRRCVAAIMAADEKKAT